MSSNEMKDSVVEAVRHVQMIARNPGGENFKDYGKASELISTIRKHIFRKPIRVVGNSTKRKYERRIKTEQFKKLEDESSDTSISSRSQKSSNKSRASSKKQKDEKRSDIVKSEKKEQASRKSVGGYCIDCNMTIDQTKEPWTSMKPCKQAQRRNRGKHLGQSQYQMESYLDCVNNLYNTRSAIPRGLHSTQIYLFNRARLLGQLCSDLAPSSPLENWTPREIAIFEAAISVYGKEFYNISKCIRSKTTQEVIEFYYTWKFSSHYYAWKTHYKSPYDDVVVRGG